MVEREGIQREYDQMEQEYNLQCSELNAARERISLLLQQLERSEQMVSITQENCQKEKDILKHKVSFKVCRCLYIHVSILSLFIEYYPGFLCYIREPRFKLHVQLMPYR